MRRYRLTNVGRYVFGPIGTGRLVKLLRSVIRGVWVREGRGTQVEYYLLYYGEYGRNYKGGSYKRNFFHSAKS